MVMIINPFRFAGEVQTPDDAVVYLGKFEGADGATSSTDSALGGVDTPHVMTFNNTAQIDTATQAVGLSSLLLSSGDWVNMTDSADWDLDGDQKTIEFFVRFRSLPSGGYMYILSQFESGINGDYSEFSLEESGGTYTLYYNMSATSAGVSGVGLSGVVTPSIGTWYHVAMSAYTLTGDGANRVEWVLYWDGVVLGTFTSTPTSNWGNFIADFQLGGINGDVNTHNFDGHLDEVRVTKNYAWYRNDFSGVIPEWDFTNGFTPYIVDWWDDCVLLVPCNGTNGSTVVNDYSDTKVYLQTLSSSISTAQSKFGGASLQFTRPALCDTPDKPAFTLGTDDFSIECWVRFTNITGDTLNNICNQWSSTATNAAFRLDADDSGNLIFKVVVGSTEYTATLAAGFVNNVWYHVAGTRNGPDLQCWADGVGSAVTDVSTLSINDSSENFGLGGSGAVSTTMDGFIDDFRWLVGRSAYNAAFLPPTEPWSRMQTKTRYYEVAGAGNPAVNGDYYPAGYYGQGPLYELDGGGMFIYKDFDVWAIATTPGGSPLYGLTSSAIYPPETPPLWAEYGTTQPEPDITIKWF